VEWHGLGTGGQRDSVQRDREHDRVSLHVRGELHVEWHELRGRYANLHVRGKTIGRHGLEHGFELYADMDRQRLGAGRQRDNLRHDGECDVLPVQVRGELQVGRRGVRSEHADLCLRGQAVHGNPVEFGFELSSDVEWKRVGSRG
jgi:hypothetical protein